jgi:hypothetical protein
MKVLSPWMKYIMPAVVAFETSLPGTSWPWMTIICFGWLLQKRHPLYFESNLNHVGSKDLQA